MRHPRHKPEGLALARTIGKLHEVTRHDAVGYTRHAGIRIQVLTLIRRQQKQRVGKARIKSLLHDCHLRPQISPSGAGVALETGTIEAARLILSAPPPLNVG